MFLAVSSSVLESPSRLDEEHRLIARYAARLAAEASNSAVSELYTHTCRHTHTQTHTCVLSFCHTHTHTHRLAHTADLLLTHIMEDKLGRHRCASKSASHTEWDGRRV